MCSYYFFFIVKNYIFTWLGVSGDSVHPARSGQCTYIVLKSDIKIGLIACSWTELKVTKLNVGCYISSVCVSIFIFPHDILLFASTWTG
jgi:hypothetical protein